MSLQVSYKKQFLLMLMLVIVFFAVLEGLLRIYDYYNPRCDFMSNPLSKDMDYEFKKQICDMWKNHIVYLDPTSGISQNVPNQHFLTVNINSHGFRGPEIFIEKPDDTYRIFVVGGSTTFSIRALSDQHTIPGYLQQKFDEVGLDKKIEVINAGIDAVTSTDELQLVKSKIVHYKPDLIIIYDGHNDVVNFPGKIKNKFNDDVITQIWKGYLTFYETPFVVGGIIADAKVSISGFVFDTNFEDKVKVWKNNLITICELGNEFGYDTVVILQPFLGTGNKTLTEHEIELYENKFHDDLVSGYQLFANELDDLENHCSSSADFRNIFDDVKKSVYFDRAHVSSESNEIISDKIFEVVEPLVN